MKKILISDKHIGTTLWQHAVISKLLGRDVHVNAVSLSNHASYAPSGVLTESLLVRHIHWMPRWLVWVIYPFSTIRGTSLAVCSFPPARTLDLLKLPRVKILLNVGHRLHIHLDKKQMHQFSNQLTKAVNKGKLVVASMSEYDFHYIRYHLDLEPIRLPVVAEHIDAKYRFTLNKQRSHSHPSSVLIGPTHMTEAPKGFSPEELRNLSRARRGEGRKELEFEYIRNRYPKGEANPDKLSKHAAIVIFPYSAFSISMIELYQMNIPFFVPADDLLIGRMNDVHLSPLYHNNFTQEKLEEEYTSFGRKRGYDKSPHSTSPEAESHWLKYMFFNQMENVIRFDSAESLIDLLHTSNLKKIEESMREENTERYAKDLEEWRRFLTSGKIRDE